MFERRQPSPVATYPSPDPQVIEMPLQLLAQRSGAIYQLPLDLVHSLRHMVTKLGRGQQLPTKIAVVSALRQEGVSFVTQALATLMAHDLSRRICLVDLNWWWPSAPMQELAHYHPGLLPVLQGVMPWEAAIVPTNHPQLSILPAGLIPATQRPVLARSTALQVIMKELSKGFDHLIFDVPAILSTSDAIPLASLSDASCIVVQQGISNRGTVKRALQEIDHVPTLGVVMNRVQVATPSWLLRWIPQE